MAASFKLLAAVFLVLFVAEASHVDVSFGNRVYSDHVLCIEREKQALLSFKQDLVDPSHRLSSWAAEDNDCCRWGGIVCNNITAHVNELHLSSSHDLSYDDRLKGKISPSLLNLKHLTHLDLSNNDFGGTQIPSFLGSLVSLRYLNLAKAGFEGKIPHQLGNLSSLSHLDLEGLFDPFYGYRLYADSLHWLSSLSSLQYLDMSNMDLGQASDWLLSINKLPSLLVLNLSSSELTHIHALSRVNFTSLAVFDISVNRFSSLIPDWIFSLDQLVHLDLGESSFEGPFPNGSWSLPSLKSLNVSLCVLNCSLPNWLFNLSSMEYLDLHRNSFGGSIPCALQNMTRLKYIDLSGNELNSTIPNCFYSLLPSLEHLDLSSNAMHGVISSAIGNLTSLISLDLSFNALEGKITPSFGSLCNLESIWLSYNRFNGKISEAFESLLGCNPNRLKSLSLGGNSFAGQISHHIGEFKNLVVLGLESNLLSGPIPMSLGNLTNLESLYILGNKLNGSLPERLGSMSNLQDLYISDNLLEGVVSEVHFSNLTKLRYLYASKNSLILKVSPNWIAPFRLRELRLRSWKLGPKFPMWLKSQSDIEDMDLSDAGISGVIPNWLWNLSSQSLYLNLSHNQLHGKIPDMPRVGSFFVMFLGSNKFEGPLPRISSNVRELDLSNNFFSGDFSHFLCHHIGVRNRLVVLQLGENHLSGNIPDCWMYWPFLEMINLGSNNLTSEIPSSMGLLPMLESLHLRNNSLVGEIPQSLRNCTMLTFIDLSLNKFVGDIPTWIGVELPNLRILTLRANKLSGQIPFEICFLSQLQILDVAHNNLSGSIPRCFNNFTAMLTKPDSDLPSFYSSGFGNTFNIFFENAFLVTRGREDQYDTILTLVASLDLSNNNLSGKFPEELTTLQGLLSINLSGNHLRGKIPETIGNLTWVQSLDLSRNQLTGKIPPSISGLSFLSHFNVSHNNLSGEIPSSTQLQSLDPSSFIGNHLCGPPLPRRCREVHNTTPAVTEDKGQKEGDGDDEEYWFRLGVAVGFAVGFLGVISPMVFYGFYRRAYFWFLEEYLWYKILDCYIKFKLILVRN